MTIALDIGATKIAAGLVKSGKIIKKIKIPTQAERGKSFLVERIFQVIESFQGPTPVIGIGIAGQVNQKKGNVLLWPNYSLKKEYLSLRDILKKQFKGPVFIDNDAHCFTLGEAFYGEGKNYKYIVGLTLGTGIGSGIVINKKIYRGKWSNIEIGHMTIQFAKGRKCKCGLKGCFESYASATGLIKTYQTLSGHPLNPYIIVEKAKAGEKRALKAIQLTREALISGLVNVIHTLSPEIIILGGGFSQVKLLTSGLTKEVQKRLFYPPFKKTRIILSKLGEDAGILGAALAAEGQMKK